MLEGLINLGIDEAKQHLERALIIDIRKPPVEYQGDRAKLSGYYRHIQERIWRHLENGELDAEQHGRLLELLAESHSVPDKVTAPLAR